MSVTETPLVRELRAISILGFPLASVLLAVSRFDTDPQTASTISQLRTLLPQTGVLVFDAHRTEFDILATTVTLGFKIPGLNHLAGLIAAKWVQGRFFGRRFHAAITHDKPHLHLHTVLRREDDRFSSPDQFSSRGSTNASSLAALAEDLCTPQTLAVIAPYGSRYKFGQIDQLRWGALDLACRYPTICSLASFSPSSGYAIHLSQILEFDSRSPHNHIKSILQNIFTNLVSQTA